MHWFTLTMIIIGALAVSVQVMKLIDKLERGNRG